MTMTPGNETDVLVPAEERFAMSLGSHAPAAPTPVPAAQPAETFVPAAAAPQASDALNATIEQLNDNLLAIVGKITSRTEAEASATAAAASAPDPVAALLAHPDAEIRALAEGYKVQQDQLRTLLSRDEQRSNNERESAASEYETRLNAQEAVARQKFKLNDAEVAHVWDQWTAATENDKRLAVLTFEEALSRVYDPAGLEARRAGARPPSAGEGIVPAPAPAAARVAPRVITETAAGGGRAERAVLNGHTSNADATRLALKEKFGIG